MIGKAFLALVFLLSLATPLLASAATLSISPKSGTYEVGKQVVVKVLVQGDSPLNAVTGVVSFPSSLFSIESVSKSGSILNFWIAEPTFSRSSGTVQFEGISLSGFQGGTGTIVTVTLRALKVGSGSITFQSGQILANDGQGTDITGGLHGGSFLIEPAKEKPASTKSPEPIVAEDVVEPVSIRKSAPTIRLDEQDGHPVIIGVSAYPKAGVVLTFVPLTGIKVFITGEADDKGLFSLPVPTALRDGPYAVTAGMVLKDNSQSEPSQPLSVNVQGEMLGRITYEVTTYASLVVLFFLLPLFFYFLWRKLGPRKHVHQELRKEIRDAEEVLHKSFVLIREDLYNHRKSGRSKNKSTPMVADDVSEVEASLDEAESMIEKEIHDIEKVDIDEVK